ncbi:MAG: DUF1015 family protein [Holosporales bacterium]|nr:DUF1015 family protein [Holosporales bacterium]
MKIKEFKLISFASEFWRTNALDSFLDNTDTKDKVSKTRSIMEFLKRKIAAGEAKIDSSPRFYVLSLTNETKHVTSLIAEIEYNEKNVFIPNEETHHDKTIAYKKIFEQYQMQINPILTFYDGETSIKEIVYEFISQKEPKIMAKINGLEYMLWEIKEPLELQALKNKIAFIDKLYIADGHHRFTLFKEATTKRNTSIVVSITDSESILLLSCHRVITRPIDVNWKEKIGRFCTLKKLEAIPARAETPIIILKNYEIYSVSFKGNITGRTSYYAAIERDIIDSSFGVSDMAHDVFPLPGSVHPRDADLIFKSWNNCEAIIFIPDMEIREFLNTIKNGKKLPPTSTWFEPKIIDGFIMAKF